MRFTARERQLGWAFLSGWLLGIALVLLQEDVFERVPHSWLARLFPTPEQPALHPMVVGLLQGLGSVLALLTWERRR